jgi:phosphoglycerate dehydrogenase-like enzyme
MKYCLGYEHDRCGTCQNEKNWQTLNQMPDALRLSIQRSGERVNIDKCRLTKMGEWEALQPDHAPGADHLTPDNIEAMARDLEAVSRGEAEVSAVDRDWVTQAGIIAKVIRHLQGKE